MQLNFWRAVWLQSQLKATNVKQSLIDLDKTLLPWLGRTMKGIDLFIADFFHAHRVELTKVQMIMLRVLEKNDGQPQQNLAFITNRDKASLTRLVTTMESKKLVTRVQSKEDKRINRIFITDHGRESLKNALPIIGEAIKTIQKDISLEEIEQAKKVLKKISKNINAEELTAPLNN